MTTPSPVTGLAPGRDCGTCTMCCKLLGIPELGKGPMQWCIHAEPGRGCSVHETRPETCRLFFCHYRRNPNLGPEWRPDRAKFLLYTEAGGKRLVAVTDSGVPQAWCRAPYYAQFKRWASLGAANGHQLLVFNGRRATAVLPDRDQDLGPVAVNDIVLYHRVGSRIDVEVRRHPTPA